MPEDSLPTDNDAILRNWCDALLKSLDLDDVQVDIDAVLGLAGQVARGVIRPAAPLTAFVVGYAAGRATERSAATDAQAFAAAASVARELARDGAFGPTE
jgi:hypothetical protein